MRGGRRPARALRHMGCRTRPPHRSPPRHGPRSTVSNASAHTAGFVSICSPTSNWMARSGGGDLSFRFINSQPLPLMTAALVSPADQRLYFEPKVTVLSRPDFSEPEHLPVEWQGDSSGGEPLAGFAGRLCYMSQHNPARRAKREHPENIKKHGAR